MIANIVQNAKKVNRPLPGMGVWLDASQPNTLWVNDGIANVQNNGDLVYRWDDISGNGRNAYTANSLANPAWFKPVNNQSKMAAVSFNGVSNSMVGPWMPIFNTFTMYVLSKHRSGGDTDYASIFYLGNHNQGGMGCGRRLGWQYATLFGMIAVGDFYYGVSGGYESLIIRFSGANYNYINNTALFINGSNVSNIWISRFIPPQVGYSLAALNGGTTNFADIEIGEVLMYGQSHSDTEILYMSKYLREKWGTP